MDLEKLAGNLARQAVKDQRPAPSQMPTVQRSDLDRELIRRRFESLRLPKGNTHGQKRV